MAVAKKNVLIIGGGAGGVIVASSLSQSLDPRKFSLQLVTDRPYSIHYPAMLRVSATSEDDWENRALPTFEKLFAPGKAGEVINGRVTSIVDGTAHLADGRALHYDYLCLATGSRWDGAGPIALPTDRKETHEWINNWHDKLKKSKNIVVVGGGAAGIEMCGEIRHYYPDKKVTLVHGGAALLNNAYPDHFRKTLLDAVQDKGIDVILRDRAIVPDGTVYSSIKTENGLTIPADLVLSFRGGRLETGYLKTLDPTVLTAIGAVKVLPTLRVPLANGKTNVFAVGDIIDSTQQKTVAKVPAQAAVVAANMLAATKGVIGTKEYKGYMEIMVVTFGPKGGVGWLPVLWGFVIGDFLVRLLKGKNLFVDQARARLVAPTPSIFATALQAIRSFF